MTAVLDEKAPVSIDLWETPENVYRTEIRLTKEEGGGFSAYVPRLPGVASQGETIEEATRRIQLSLTAALKEYLQSNTEIPWTKPKPSRKSEISKMVFVHA